MDLEQGCHHHHSMIGSDTSMCFSDVGDGSFHYHLYSTNVITYGNYNNACGFNHEVGYDVNSQRVSSVTDSLEEVVVESEVPEIEIEVPEIKVERNCRICQLGLESDDSQELETSITLGCSCKDDLSIAHKNCAETWFNIKGDRTCEICHSIAQNVFGATEEIPDTLSNQNSPTAASTQATSEESQSFCHDHHFLLCLLVLIIFIFVISLIFQFNKSS